MKDVGPFAGPLERTETVNPVAVAYAVFLVSIPTSVLLGTILLRDGIRQLWDGAR